MATILRGMRRSVHRLIRLSAYARKEFDCGRFNLTRDFWFDTQYLCTSFPLANLRSAIDIADSEEMLPWLPTNAKCGWLR